MARRVGSEKQRSAYAFLLARERDGAHFTVGDLSDASGWTEGTTRAYLTKKLKHYVKKTEQGLVCDGVSSITEEAFCRLLSQTAALSTDPERPLLEAKVEGLVRKAREAALAAVQHYNNPTAEFRTANFLVLMVIAYTALFHAIMEREGVDYRSRDRKGKNITVKGGDPHLWDMIAGAKWYRKQYCKLSDAALQNLQMLRQLRNQIEHRYMPQLDARVAGHCQAMLLNFETIVMDEFTSYYSLRTSLALALQLSGERCSQQVDAMRRLQSEEYEAVEAFISGFEAKLPVEVAGDQAYQFRVWLVPKPGNRATSSDLAIEFVNACKLDEKTLQSLERGVVATRTRYQQVRDSDTYCLKAGDVAERVENDIGKRFSHSWHLPRAAQILGVRPSGNSTTPADTDVRYCSYDRTWKAYRYTEGFVKLLVKRYSDGDQYEHDFVRKKG